MRLNTKLAICSALLIGLVVACGGRTSVHPSSDPGAAGQAGEGAAGEAGQAGSGDHGGDGGSYAGAAGTAGAAGQAGGSAAGSAGDNPQGGMGGEPLDAGPDSPEYPDVIPPPDGPEEPDGNPVTDCLSCLQTQCGSQIGSCLTDSACLQGVQCSLTQCISGGQPDLPCVLGCFNGDMTAALNAITVLQCVTVSCNCVPANFGG